MELNWVWNQFPPGMENRVYNRMEDCGMGMEPVFTLEQEYEIEKRS